MRGIFRLAAWSAWFVGMLALGGCGKKPPECADAAATQSLRQFMNDAAVEGARLFGTDVTKDPDEAVKKYLASWTFELSNVTTQGYDENSRTRSCAGRVSITIPNTNETGYVDTQYTMQTLEDAKSGDFQLKVAKNYESWSYGTSKPLGVFYRNNRTAGVWSGSSQCGATEVRSSSLGEISKDEIGQGYTVEGTERPWTADTATAIPVELTIAGGKAEMKISAEGKSAIRNTEVGERGTLVFQSKDEFETTVPGQGLIADGQFTQPDASGPNVAVPAKVKSNATGNVLDVVLVRTCTLKLAKK